MAKISRPRFGSLQFWPRKRALKAVPRVNWEAIDSEAAKDGFIGILAFKVGMATAILRDKTDKSMTAQKKIALPVTILEVPKFKIFSVRFYKNGTVAGETVLSNDKELKRVLKVPKNVGSLEKVPDFDEIRVLVHPVMKGLFKKTPPIFEVAIRSSYPVSFVKQWIGKDISLKDVNLGKVVDARSLTKGKGFSGPVKRYGISLKSHKSEKGVRRPGSLGPWHPARVTFRIPMAGQLGMFTRIQYNMVIVSNSAMKHEVSGLEHGFKRYGTVKGDYIIVVGSVHGPPKREIVITPAMRPTKKQSKK